MGKSRCRWKQLCSFILMNFIDLNHMSYYILQMGNQVPISKNYNFPESFLKATSHTMLQYGEIKQFNIKNTISPEFICDTYQFGTNKRVHPMHYKKSDVQSLIVLTYNVWFQDKNQENRLPHLLKLMKQSNADFICLQEVTKNFLDKMISSGYFKDYYINRSINNWYDFVILSKFKCKMYKIPFSKTYMSRSLILAETIIGDKQILVGSVHFQSLQNTDIRIEQIKQAFYSMDWSSIAILCGDFNFSDGAKQNQFIKQNFIDLWKNKFPKQNGFTMLKTPKYNAWRPDHILIKNTKLQKSKIAIIGNFTVPPFEHELINAIQSDGMVRTPSDHLGLISELFL